MPESKPCQGLKPAILLKRETLAQVFSSEFFEISKNTFFIEHLWTTASESNCDDEEEGAEYKVKRIKSSDWCVCSAKAVFGKIAVFQNRCQACRFI